MVFIDIDWNGKFIMMEFFIINISMILNDQQMYNTKNDIYKVNDGFN